MNLKPFEITASGAACLCAWRAGFDDCFKKGEEAVSFRSPTEAAGKARELLESPATLAAIAERGHARTLADHTWSAWARDILSGVLGTSAR